MLDNLAVTFTIYGAPRVKKNNQKVVYNSITKKSTKYNTPAYNKWHTKAIKQFAAAGFDRHFKVKRERDPSLKAMIDFPVNLGCQFFLDRDGVVDLSALYEGIQDTMVEVGLLSDDNYKLITGHDGSGAQVDKANPRMEITITPKETGYEKDMGRAATTLQNVAPAQTDKEIF